MKPHRRSPTSAFTLVELLVSSVILALLIILLFGMADGASRLWRDGEHRHVAAREARAGLTMIAEDLHSAVITSNPSTLLIEEHDQNFSGSSLFFLVSLPWEKRSPGSGGDLCAAGYFVAEEPGGSGVRNLYRFHSSGESVAKALETKSLKELYASASPENSLTTELLARHIVQLEVKHLAETEANSGSLMITISAIAGETARILSSEPQAKQRNERLLRQHMQRYTTIVRLPPEREIPSGS